MNPQATGGLDPTPPHPGVIALGLVPHLLLIASAALAIYLWRHRDARHRPAAIGLTAIAGAGFVRYLLAPLFDAAGPYEGWLRALFHLDQGLYLVSVAALPWMALLTLGEQPPDLPPGPTEGPLGRVSAWLVLLGAFCVLLGAFGATWSLLVLGYPEVRGDALRRVYLGAELAAIFLCALAIAAWLRRRRIHRGTVQAEGMEVSLTMTIDGPRWYTLAVVLGLALTDAALLFVGAWPRGLYGSAYAVQQGGLLVLYAALVGVHVVALALTRPRP